MATNPEVKKPQAEQDGWQDYEGGWEDQPTTAKPAPSPTQSPSEQPGLLDRTIPLSSYGNATMYGLQNIGRGLRQFGQAAWEMGKPPQDKAEAASLLLGPIGPATVRTMRGLGQTVKEAADVPAAIRDINQGPDPAGAYADVAARTAGEGAGQAVGALATEGVVRAPYGRIARTTGKVAGDLPVMKTFGKIPEFWEATSPEGQTMAVTREAVKQRNAAWIPMRVPRSAASTSSAIGSMERAVAPEVTVIPEPRATFPGETPNYMASVPREELSPLAMTRKPGAGTQMQQLGKPVIYTPAEAGFPGPRTTTLFGPEGEPIRPVSGGSEPMPQIGESVPETPLGRIPRTRMERLQNPTAPPAAEYDWRMAEKPAQDIGERVRSEKPSLPRERRARVRTPEEDADTAAWKAARDAGDEAGMQKIEEKFARRGRGL